MKRRYCHSIHTTSTPLHTPVGLFRQLKFIFESNRIELKTCVNKSTRLETCIPNRMQSIEKHFSVCWIWLCLSISLNKWLVFVRLCKQKIAKTISLPQHAFSGRFNVKRMCLSKQKQKRKTEDIRNEMRTKSRQLAFDEIFVNIVYAKCVQDRIENTSNIYNRGNGTNERVRERERATESWRERVCCRYVATLITIRVTYSVILHKIKYECFQHFP